MTLTAPETARRPLSVTLIACVYIAMGTIGFVYHVTEFDPRQPFQGDFVWVEIVRLLAIVSGVFMLRGHNWARWLALVWIGYHVILSVFHTVPELVMHGVFFVVLAYFLLGANATRYFRDSRA